MNQAVLFVDDDPEILSSIKRMLRKESYSQYYVQSAKKALDLLESTIIDVVISDLMMPEMNGLTFLMKVKEKYPDTIRIILSGYAQVSVILSSIENGDIFRYITKPWKLDNSAKNTIQDALEYNNYFRNKSTTNKDNLCFSKQDLNSLFKYFKTGCIIRDTDKKTIFISDNMDTYLNKSEKNQDELFTEGSAILQNSENEISVFKIATKL